MSTKELDRLEIISRVLEHRLTQRKAAEQLGLSLRQVERLCRAFRSDGAAGLVSRKRGRRSNRMLSSAVRERAVDLVRSLYAGFGPTLACEKLTEQHGFDLSRETLRRWMIETIGAGNANKPLPCSVFFDKAPRVPQGAVVANKRLGAVLSKIRRDQQERDRQRLARRSLTNRQKTRIRTAAAKANASGSP